MLVMECKTKRGCLFTLYLDLENNNDLWQQYCVVLLVLWAHVGVLPLAFPESTKNLMMHICVLPLVKNLFSWGQVWWLRQDLYKQVHFDYDLSTVIITFSVYAGWLNNDCEVKIIVD